MALRIIAGLALLVPAMASVINHHRADHRPQCGQDECYRALLQPEGARLTRGVRDCSSYLVTTVTPYTRTITVTMSSPALTYTPTVTSEVTETVTATAILAQPDAKAPSHFKKSPAPLAKRMAAMPIHLDERKIPVYAFSACPAGDTATARFSSACSCLGVRATTVVAPPPYTTETVYPFTAETPVTVLTTVATETIKAKETNAAKLALLGDL